MTTDHDHNAEIAAYGLCRVCTGRTSRAAAEARDTAIYEAFVGANERWLTDAYATVRAVAASIPEWTTDDIWSRLASPAEPRALGAVLRDLAEQGLIAKTGAMRNSTRPECHARPLAVWSRTPDPALF